MNKHDPKPSVELQVKFWSCLAVIVTLGMWWILSSISIDPLVAQEEQEAANASQPALMRVTAQEIRDDYQGNVVVADKKYQGVYIVIEGTVESITGTAGSQYCLRLEGGVSCFFDSANRDDLSPLSPGQKIAISGVADGPSIVLNE